MEKLKNWWLQITALVLVILDLGFEIINPLLLEIGVNEKTANIVKILFSIFAIVKSKYQLPSQNIDKMQDILNAKK